MISQDLAELLANLGFSLKLRGNDDALADSTLLARSGDRRLFSVGVVFGFLFKGGVSVGDIVCFVCSFFCLFCCGRRHFEEGGGTFQWGGASFCVLCRRRFEEGGRLFSGGRLFRGGRCFFFVGYPPTQKLMVILLSSC